MSRFAVPPGAGRHLRRPGEARPERLALVRPLRVRAGRPATGLRPSIGHRISLVLAPRIEIRIDDRTPPPAGRPSGPPEPRGASVLTTRVERLVRRVERHATRIERSERVLADPVVGPGSVPPSVTASVAPVLEPAPRLVPARPAGPTPAEPPVSVAEAAAPAREPAFGWRPPDPAALADGVLRELDRRIVAERERRGGLA